MRHITINSIYLHAFKSFTKATIVSLTTEPGLKFLGGKNLVEPRLGSNGSGKSTIFEAICWCLYGTGTRGQKAADLVSYGENQPHVIITLTIDDETHTVDRRGSPNRLLIDKAVASPGDVERLVGLSRDRFLQSVLFGQAVPLFLDLSTAARGELLDSVLDLSLWMDLSEAAGRQATVLGQKAVKLDQELSFETGKLSGLDEKEAQQSFDTWKHQNREEFERIVSELSFEEDCAKTEQDLIQNLDQELLELPDQRNFDGLLQEVQERKLQIQQAEDAIGLYEQDRCPKCRRPFGDHFAKDQISSWQDEIEVFGTVAEQDALIEKYKQEREKAYQLTTEISKARRQMAIHTSRVEMLTKRAEQIGEQENPHTERLVGITASREAALHRMSELTAELFTVKGKQLQAEYWKAGFKKVRLFQVKQVLIRMEIETANAAAALGISGWKIRYVTETETKSGTMKPGIQVVVSTPQYEGKWENYSGGETQRIRLAVTLGLSAMIQAMAGVTYGFEIFDEASQYLSVEGIEDLLSCLQARAEMTKKSIWVVDHSALSFGGFDEIWQVTKDHGGSKVALLSQSN